MSLSMDSTTATSAKPVKKAKVYSSKGFSPLAKRRWQNFKNNRRGWWSLWFFLVLFVLSLGAEFIANDKPIVLSLSLIHI